MRILILGQDFPNPYAATGMRIFSMLPYLSKKHDISLIAFKEMTKEDRYRHNIEEYCKTAEAVNLQARSTSQRMMFAILNIFSKNYWLVDYYHSSEMETKVGKLLETKDFEIIYAQGPPMAQYVYNNTLPKVLEPGSAISRSFYQHYIQENFLPRKIFWYLQHIKAKNYEMNMYKKFDMCIVDSLQDKDILKSYLPNLNVFAIPYGVDCSYFKPMSNDQNSLNLVFVGVLNATHNVSAILYFYNEIYPLIKQRLPSITLFLVGRNPSKEIQQLALDTSVVVTGYVKDVRTFLAAASVVIVPMTSGSGIKIKILEAMAMGKAVVTTSIGARGIGVTPEENIIIADDPKEFLNRVVELLNDEELRKKIGVNARKLVEEEYSWEKMTDMLNDIFQKVVNGR